MVLNYRKKMLKEANYFDPNFKKKLKTAFVLAEINQILFSSSNLSPKEKNSIRHTVKIVFL